ncbi:CU044_2847 family protein [Mesorhizobium sp. 128a]
MEKVMVRLPSGNEMLLEAEIGGREEVAAGDSFDFNENLKVLQEVGSMIGTALQTARPTEAQVEIGLDAAVEAGKHTALIVKGSGSASLKVTLKWSSKP